jgi:hypothetical protein
MKFKSLGILVASSALLAGATAVAAQEIFIEDDAAVVEEPAIVTDDADVAVIERPAGPRVYGWTALRPVDCGTFHYWDGAECADARDAPPVE